MNSSDINNQMKVTAVTLKKDLKHMIYISINETSTVYMTELQNLIITTDIAKVMKTEESEL